MSLLTFVTSLFKNILSSIKLPIKLSSLFQRKWIQKEDPVASDSQRSTLKDNPSESEPLLANQPSKTGDDRTLPPNSGSVPPHDSAIGAELLSVSQGRSRSISSMGGDSLKEKLRKIRVRREDDQLSFFVPFSEQKALITPSTVEEHITKSNNISPAKASEYASLACLGSLRIFAALATIEKEHEIISLLEEGVTDQDLPFGSSMKGSNFTLQRNNGGLIRCFAEWDDQDQIENFLRFQWCMNAPIFKYNEHYDFHKNTVLPFIPINGSAERKEGAYSEVIPVRIHDAHHKFWPSNDPEDARPLVAIKKLFSEDRKEFEKEQSILTSIGVKRHPHLIDLLVTYRYEDKFHLMFPYAGSNLRGYWEARPNPNFDRKTLIWSIKQMAGIASGLLLVHNFRVTIPLGVSGGVRMHKGAHMSVGEGEERFGRHGDIKPENILWFDRIYGAEPGQQDKMGILKIADFGLGRFHGRDSRSALDPRFIVTSPTYEPPECKLKKPVSRAYDLWSLGCLYMEFVTWLMMGVADIEGFADFRGKTGTGGINDDNFFTITTPPGSIDPEAELRREVKLWAEKLHSHERCSQAIHELVDLIMKGLLVIQQKNRINAVELNKRLKGILKRAQEDSTYLLIPNPYPTRIGELRSISEPTLSDGQDRKRKKVTFADDLSRNDLSTVNLPVQTNAPLEDLLSNVRNLTPIPSQAPTWPLVHSTT